MSENVLTVFSTRHFIVSCLRFKSLSHFEFIFVHGVRLCSGFIDLHAVLEFSKHHLLKRVSFSHFVLFYFIYFVLFCFCLFRAAFVAHNVHVLDVVNLAAMSIGVHINFFKKMYIAY